ncbi:YunG family protein [Falsibacillus pallidus]|uniref:YunG family protein n=1 Tax=Falsibacillus pallidus TaxID=493781 RepID=UPI003D9924EB
MKPTIGQLREALLHSWSLETSTKWEKDCPAKGQCGVTSLVVQDILGGEIFKTKTFGGWHYYNKVDEKFIDFTDAQFNEAIEYEHIPASREEAMSDTNDYQYNTLKSSVMNFYIPVCTEQSLDRISLLQ